MDMEPIKLIWQEKISERATINDEFVIAGTAINETTTSNNHKFIAEELRMAAPTLEGVPLLIDHENKVDNIKGRVIEGRFNESDKKIDFKAKVMDKNIRDMIADGRLNSVSVGAAVKDIEESEGGELIPRGIIFQELSLVAIPADSGATFDIAMKEAYEGLKSSHKGIIDTAKKEEKQMSEEQEQETVQPEAEETESEAPKEEAEEPKEEPKAEEKLDVDAIVAKAVAAAIKAVKESDEDKAKEEPKEEPEAEEDEEEVSESFKIEQGSRSFSLVRNSY